MAETQEQTPRKTPHAKLLEVERAQMKANPSRFEVGDTVRVNVRIREGDRERVQAFQGICIGRSGEGFRETFTVRKISFGIGVERIFPVHSPRIESVQVTRHGHVRKAKLYYLRGRIGKRATLVKEQKRMGSASQATPEPVAASEPAQE